MLFRSLLFLLPSLPSPLQPLPFPPYLFILSLLILSLSHSTTHSFYLIPFDPYPSFIPLPPYYPPFSIFLPFPFFPFSFFFLSFFSFSFLISLSFFSFPPSHFFRIIMFLSGGIVDLPVFRSRFRYLPLRYRFGPVKNFSRCLLGSHVPFP